MFSCFHEATKLLDDEHVLSGTTKAVGVGYGQYLSDLHFCLARRLFCAMCTMKKILNLVDVHYQVQEYTA